MWSIFRLSDLYMLVGLEYVEEVIDMESQRKGNTPNFGEYGNICHACLVKAALIEKEKKVELNILEEAGTTMVDSKEELFEAHVWRDYWYVDDNTGEELPK